MSEKLKDIAKAFLQGIVDDKVQEVYELYTLPDFKHHNAYYPGNREALLEGMIESNKVFPNKKLSIKLTVAEPPYVTVLSHVQITEGKEISAVHVFRFEGDKIAEMWDISQELPEHSLNENGMF